MQSSLEQKHEALPLQSAAGALIVSTAKNILNDSQIQLEVKPLW
jgi:hypothetical protein